jgi:outer membrane protein assembly factor BamB
LEDARVVAMRAVAVSLAYACVVVAAGEEARALREAAGFESGLVVQAGAKSTTLARSLVADRSALALIVAEPSRIPALRREAADTGLLGQLSVLPPDGGRLPLIDLTADLVIVGEGDLAGVPAAEFRRVLRPGGALARRAGTAWLIERKPEDPAYDAWPQFRRDGSRVPVSRDTAVGPSRGLQWLAVPDETLGGSRSRNQAGWRIADHIGVVADDQGLTAYNIHNGLALWRQDELIPLNNMDAFLIHRGKVYYLAQKRPSHQHPVMHVELDLRTGKVLRHLEEGLTDLDPQRMRDAVYRGQRTGPGGRAGLCEAVAEGRYLVQAFHNELAAVDLDSGSRLWTRTLPAEECFVQPCLGKGRVYVVEGPPERAGAYRMWPVAILGRVRAYDLASGAPAWTFQLPAAAEQGRSLVSFSMCLSPQGDLVLGLTSRDRADPTRVLLLDPATGRQKCLVPVGRPNVHGHFMATPVGERLVMGSWGGTVVAPYEALANPEKWSRRLSQYAPTRCGVWTFTSDYMIGGLSMARIDPPEIHHTNVARPPCDSPSFPAYGLVVTNGFMCTCHQFIRGGVATHPRRWDVERPRERIERGTAAAPPVPPVAAVAAGDCWPAFLRDSARTGWNTQTRLGTGPLRLHWTQRPTGSGVGPPLLASDWANLPHAPGTALTGPSVADGRVVVGVVHRHQVVCLDAASGAERWRTVLDGRVAQQPVLHGGLVLASTQAGSVYALTADGGAVVWRFQAAPSTEMLVSHGQLESVWPAGCITVVGEHAYVIAGRSTEIDGGLWWWRLDPRSGAATAAGRWGQYDRRYRLWDWKEPEWQDAQVAHDNRNLYPGTAAIGDNTVPITDGERFLLSASQRFRIGPKGLEVEDWVLPGVRPYHHQVQEAWAVISPIPLPGSRGLTHFGQWFRSSGGLQYVYQPGRDTFFLLNGQQEIGNRGPSGSQYLSRFRVLHEDTKAALARPPQRRPQTELLWQVDLGWGAGLRTMAASADRVVVARRLADAAKSRRLTVVDSETGDIVQDLHIDFDVPLGGVAIAGGRVYVAGRDGTLACYAP